MSFDPHKNFAWSLIATAPSPAASGTTASVTAGQGSNFPSVPFNAVICPAASLPTNANAEIVRVTAMSGDSITAMTRAQEGSSARTVVVGDQIFAAVSAKTLTDIEAVAKTGATATVTLSDGATPALDASLGSVFRLAAAGNRTIAVPTNAVGGQKIVIEHFASGGARTLALNSGAGGFRFGSDIASLSATASGKTDYIGCIYNDTDSKWDVVAVTKGF